ncbi:hypothetical protein EOPP23_18840 [Endozoicomonas sp. OPT23]|uniref:hypothetical protein n=1 Tax=Endozoicomonas sp. OPT23 TaxID=2072845 RepID=UPI00129C0C6E|nr:hypothetical protein [Endozoicomonas sp. OPT23]MRI35037.1 hypothetical protein [Endozoicomonas sp. OPT23]
MNREFSPKACFAVLFCAITLLALPDSARPSLAGTMPNYSAENIRTGTVVDIKNSFKGQVLLIVNVPMDCKGKNQFVGLQKLYQRYRDRGFVVIGLVSNQFRPQLYADKQHFLEDCRKRYKLSFPMFEHKGPSELSDDPLFHWLEQDSGVAAQDDFTKYLVGRNLDSVKAYAHSARPDDIRLSVSIGKLLQVREGKAPD